MTDHTPRIGDRYEDDDPRQGNRVIRITDTLNTLLGTRYEYRVEVAELNPTTVGRRHTIRARTLRNRYTRISR